MQPQKSLCTATSKSHTKITQEIDVSRGSQTFGFKFSNYSVMHLIGSGANGECYVAKNNDSDEYVAIKKIRKDIGVYEVRCLNQLNPHANIVRILGFQDIETESPLSYQIALELADCDLADMIGFFGLDSIDLNPDQISHIFKNILLGYLHIRKNNLLDATDFDDSNTLYFSKKCIFKISDFDCKLEFKSDPERLKSLARLFHIIAARFSHKCKAIQTKESRAMCEPFCLNIGTPLTDEKNWQSVLLEREVEIILAMDAKKISSEKLHQYSLELEGRSFPFKAPPSLKPMRMIDAAL